MSHPYFPAISTFDEYPDEASAIGCDCVGAEIIGHDTLQLRVAPSGVSVKGRYWREGPYLKALVHVQAAAAEPRTISAQVDLRPIARALKKKLRKRSGVRVSGWPGNFVKAVKKIGKSKLVKSVSCAVKNVVQSKLTGAAVGATAVVFPPVGVPAAAAYATANAAIAAIDRANAVKNEARKVLAYGTAQQKIALKAKVPEVRAALARAKAVRSRLAEIGRRARSGDVAAVKTARIFNHVMQHRQRVQQYDRQRRHLQQSSCVVLTNQGRVVPQPWLRAAAAQANSALRRLP